jgi:hypothetical protein
MKPHVSVLIALAFAAFAAASEAPRFQLSAGDSKGRLVWRSHTFVHDGDRLIPKDDYIVEDAKSGTISLCLEWKTEPESVSGEFLVAWGALSVPTALMEKEHYVLSVERHASDSIAFTLFTDQGILVLKSGEFPIAKAWRGSVKDLATHISNQPIQTTPTAASPETSTRGPQQSNEELRVRLVATSLTDITLGAEKIGTMDELEVELKFRVQFNPRFAVLVSTGERSQWGLTVRLLDVCRKAGVRDIKVEGAPNPNQNSP